MKKFTCLFILAALIVSDQLNAQSAKKDKFTYGPVFGIDLANYRYKLPDDQFSETYSKDPLISLNLNIALQYRFTEDFSVAIEPGFIQKGYSKYKPSYERVMNNYFQLPVLLGYEVYKGISLQAGAEFDYHIATFISQGNVFDRFPAPSNNTDFALLFGTKYTFSPYWGIGVRYSHSLSPIDEIYGSGRGNIQIFHRYFQLAVFHYW